MGEVAWQYAERLHASEDINMEMTFFSRNYVNMCKSINQTDRTQTSFPSYINQRNFLRYSFHIIGLTLFLDGVW